MAERETHSICLDKERLPLKYLKREANCYISLSQAQRSALKHVFPLQFFPTTNYLVNRPVTAATYLRSRGVAADSNDVVCDVTREGFKASAGLFLVPTPQAPLCPSPRALFRNRPWCSSPLRRSRWQPPGLSGNCGNTPSTKSVNCTRPPRG